MKQAKEQKPEGRAPQAPQYPAFVENVHAPFVYFDKAVSYGSQGGIIQVDLAGQINSPLPNGAGVHSAVTSVARLRCSPAAAMALRDCLDRALKTLAEPATIPPPGMRQ